MDLSAFTDAGRQRRWLAAFAVAMRNLRPDLRQEFVLIIADFEWQTGNEREPNLVAKECQWSKRGKIVASW